MVVVVVVVVVVVAGGASIMSVAVFRSALCPSGASRNPQRGSVVFQCSVVLYLSSCPHLIVCQVFP